MKSPNTDPLAASLAVGDEQAYASLYHCFGEKLYRSALVMLNCRDDAEDVVQEVFSAILRSRQRLEQVQDIGAYLFTTLRRLAGRCNSKRAKERFALVARGQNYSEAFSSSISPLARECDALHQALQMLPREQREIVALRLHSELTFAQIAEMLGTSVGTTVSRYRYALNRLRHSLEECRVPDDSLRSTDFAQE